MRYARISFNREFWFKFDGMQLNLFNEIGKFLPKDSKIIGFGNSPTMFIDYIFVSSNSFKDIIDGQEAPDIIVFMKKEPNGTVKVEGLDISHCLDMPNNCAHDRAVYRGLCEQYEYCSKCGVKLP